MTTHLPLGIPGSVAFFLATTLCQRNISFANSAYTEGYILHMTVLLECYYIF